MKKRVLILIASLIWVIMTISVFSYSQLIAATTRVYAVGGNVTGRVNKAPTGISGNHIGLQAGDHVMVGGNNPYTGNPLSFQLLLYDENYTDYNNTDVIDTVRTPISNWLTISDESVISPLTSFTIQSVSDAISILDTPSHTENGSSSYVNIYSDYTQTPHYKMENSFNQHLNRYAELSLMAPRNLSILRNNFNAPFGKLGHINESLAILKVANNLPAFMLFVYNKTAPWLSNITSNMLAYPNSNTLTYYYFLGIDGVPKYTCIDPTATSAPYLPLASSSESIIFRPLLYLDLDNIVFGLSNANGSGLRSTVNDKFLIDETKNYYLQGGSPMKLRMLDPTMTISFIDMKNSKGTSLAKTIKDSIVYLNAVGSTGTDNTVSALIFDSDNHLIGYQPLYSTQNGSYDYEFDTTGLAEGKYKVAVVNEVFDNSNNDPTYSSLISDAKLLEIVKPVSITAIPRSGLEVGKNVNQNDVVATYTTKDGASPITTTIISDTSVSGHENDYQLFSLNNGNVEVNNPSGLNAGDYYFKINAIDANGDPTGGVDSTTVHIVVVKTGITVAFHDPAQTKKSISDAATSWNETATATPNSGTKITYSISGGDVSLISIDPSTGAITYRGTNAFGKVKIRATVDDDPSTGNDNYNSAFVEKEIMIYREVDGSVTPDPNSSDTTIPTFTASDSNIRSGGIIGTIHGTLGTPDTIGGTTTTYHYGIKPGVGDASFFSVDTNTGVIKTTANLGVQSYHITVTVSDNWSTKEIPVTINVGVASAES